MSGVVLIADGNAERSRGLVEACRSAGIRAVTAPHGAAALEAALSELPHVVVAEPELALVDARQLAEILRANPRTHAARFVFLGRGGESVGADVGDQFLPAAASPPEVVEAVEGVLAQQRRLASLDGAGEPGSEVEGELTQLPLADLLQLFHLNRKTGRIELTRRRSPGGRSRGRRAARGAERDGQGELERGLVVVRDGDVIHAQVGAAQDAKALFRLLAWSHGRFSFHPGERGEPARIQTPTRALLVEGMRQLDEWDRLAAQLPPLDAVATLRVKSAELPNIVQPLTQEVLLLLELYSRVRDILDHCSYPDYQVLRTLHTLAERRIVKLRRGAPAAPPASGTELFHDAQIRRLRDWLRGTGAPGLPLRDAKLLVASPEPAATRDFARLLQCLPGVRLAPRTLREGFASDHLGSLGRLHVDGELGIEFVHLPMAERFAPLWPLVGHGALGTLFLLSGSVGAAATAVERVWDSLRSLPRSRVFHLMLLEKGARLSVDELRENLSLIDEASLFLLPIEGDKEPVPLLRQMLSRILP